MINKYEDINSSRLNNNSYNEINCLNNQNSSSSKNKTKFNKKNIYILNQINQDWEKIIDIIKTKKRNQTKININDKIKSEKQKIKKESIENNNEPAFNDNQQDLKYIQEYKDILNKVDEQFNKFN